MKHDFEIELRAPEGQEICDFCSSPSLEKTYDCPDFEADCYRSGGSQSGSFGGLTVHSVCKGGWAACKVCASLIDNDRWTALTDRSLQTLLDQAPYLLPVAADVRSTLARMHQQFRKLKKRPN